MADLDQMQKRFQAISRGMTLSQKVTIGATLLFTVLGFVLLLKWATKPDYTLLYANLDLKEANRMVEQLSASNVDYKLSGGGSTILIPADQVYEWRMRLASEGLPSSGGIGYEIFDKNDIGISDFVQQINYNRAVEGELARTIQGLKGVQNVRVHIVMPRERLFKEDQQDATASIVLTLRPGERLRENQIYGITNLVAASVEGMKPENVTVVDSRGEILSQPYGSDSVGGMTGSQLDLQKKVEAMLEQKAESMLSRVLGHGKAIVRVSAELNFQKIDRQRELYDPDNVAVLSEERTDETNKGGGAESDGQLEHSVTNYQVPKTVEVITGSVGDIKRLTVAVLVDGNRSPAGGGSGDAEYTPRTQEEMNMLRAVVENAVGYDPARSDRIEIQNIPFETNNTTEPVVEKPFYSEPVFWISILQKVFPFLVLIILILILRSRLKKVRLRMPQVAASLPSEGGGRGLSLQDMDVPRIDEGAPPEAVESARLLKQISLFAEEKPSLAARLVRYWLVEE